jgi:hypothetical protein
VRDWIVQEMRSDVLAIDRMYPALQLAQKSGFAPDPAQKSASR